MLGKSKFNVIKLAFISVLSLVACKQAGFQVLKPGLVSPNNFNGERSISPSARVEVIDRGVSVTWVYAGSRVDIRPSNDTLDADYVDKEKCDNPGIIEANYDFGLAEKPVVKRSECSDLSLKSQLFDKVGEYEVKLVVKSKDNESATASMTLRVVDRKIPADQIEGGFAIFAQPILAKVGQGITFTGICELRGRSTIDWDYGDSSKGSGTVTQHQYQTSGSYKVVAICTSESGKKISSSITVVITQASLPKIPDPVIVTPGTNPNIPKTPNCDPSQGPCQTASQTPQGSKTVPDQTGTYWYYDPFCKCYIK